MICGFCPNPILKLWQCIHTNDEGQKSDQLALETTQSLETTQEEKLNFSRILRYLEGALSSQIKKEPTVKYCIKDLRYKLEKDIKKIED